KSKRHVGSEHKEMLLITTLSNTSKVADFLDMSDRIQKSKTRYYRYISRYIRYVPLSSSMEDANPCACLIYLPRTCRASRPTPMPPPINIEEYLDRLMMGWRPLGTRTSIVDGHGCLQVSEPAVSLLCGP